MSRPVLLTHLQNKESSVPLETLLAALSHQLSVEKPSPTPLAAAVVSSPYFLHHAYEKLQGLIHAFQHALYLKHQLVLKQKAERTSLASALFSETIKVAMNRWTASVIKGLQGSSPLIRLCCASGLLLGIRNLEDLHLNVERLEDELVISLAEVMDIYSQTKKAGEWEREFHPEELDISLALVLASQSLPFLPINKMRALPLSSLSSLLTSTISSAFCEGNFLSSCPPSTSSRVIQLPVQSTFAERIRDISTSTSMNYMSRLSKLTAVVLGNLVDSPAASLQEANDTLEVYQVMAERIERDWKNCSLSAAQNESDVADETRELSRAVWLLLKTLLFSTIMVADEVLVSVVFSRPSTAPLSRGAPTPRKLALTTLRTLSHLSFVVSQFGGVTATATSENPGFKELRKVFYLAIDVFTSGLDWRDALTLENPCETFVEQQARQLEEFDHDDDKGTSDTLRYAKTAYILACIEQVMPLLGPCCLRDTVWRLCVPYLSEPTHRETYESAHSAILAMFASHAQHILQAGRSLRAELPASPVYRQGHPQDQPVAEHTGRGPQNEEGEFTGRATLTAAETEHPDTISFVKHLVPFYAQCLIENSEDGKLNTSQLRLAYSALVKSASASGVAYNSGSKSDFALAWYCIKVLLDAIRRFGPMDIVVENDKGEQLHRLHLTLISCVSSLPLPLMIRALEEIRFIITKHPRSTRGAESMADAVGERKTKELVEALFSEILEKVGDEEREAAMKWWYANRPSLIVGQADNSVTLTGEKGIAKQKHSDTGRVNESHQSRL